MLCEQNRCTGCGACAAKCTKGALQMRFGGEGFLEPAADETACIHCGLCERACPVLNKRDVPEKKPRAYVFKNSNTEVLEQSASGGAFSVLAAEVLQDGGVVFGAAWQENHTVKHGCAGQEAELAAFRGSKYVQSDATEAYPQVKAALEDGKSVLFTGVPCQIAGLYGYLGRDYPELYTADLVCHGGGSPKMLCEHLENLEQAKGAKIEQISHTYKTDRKFHMLIPRTVHLSFSDGTEECFDSTQDSYLNLFLNGFTYRKVCYSCPFARLPRVADLTLADFFGFGSYQRRSFDTTGGISQVLVNTEKGRVLFDRIRSGKAVWEPVRLWDCLIFNHNLWKPTEERPERDELYRVYKREGFGAVRERYYRAPQNSGNRRLRAAVKKMLGPRGTALGMLTVFSLIYGRRIREILRQLDLV